MWYVLILFSNNASIIIYYRNQLNVYLDVLLEKRMGSQLKSKTAVTIYLCISLYKLC